LKNSIDPHCDTRVQNEYPTIQEISDIVVFPALYRTTQRRLSGNRGEIETFVNAVSSM
jgi:hypothetical protein